MNLPQELYRQFTSTRLVYMAAETSAAPSAAPEAPATKPTEEPKKPEGTLDKAIDDRHKVVKKDIDAMEKGYKEKEQEAAAKLFANKMREHADSKFKDIKDNFEKDHDPAEQAFQKAIAEANKLVDSIEARLKPEEAETTIEHQYQVEQLKKTSESAEAKGALVSMYLREKYPNMKPNMANVLGRLIAQEGIIINEAWGDLSQAKAGNLEQVLNERQYLKTALDNQLTPEFLEKFMVRFLKEMPSPEVTEIEKATFQQIAENIKISPPVTKDGLTALSARFDVRYGADGQTPEYFIDLTDNKVYTPETINKKIDEIIKQNNLNLEVGSGKYKEDIADKFKDLADMRKKIDEGKIFGIGEIENFEDWAGSEEALALIDRQITIDNQMTGIKETRANQERQESDRTKLAERTKTFRSVQTEAGLTEENFNKLKEAGYKYTDKEDIPKGEETIVLTKQGSPTITIKLDGANLYEPNRPNIKVTIEGYNIEKIYTPATDFIKDISDPTKFKEMVDKIVNNIKTNKRKEKLVKDKITEIFNKHNKKSGKKDSIEFWGYIETNLDEKMMKDAPTTRLPIMNYGKSLGDIQVDLSKVNLEKPDNSEITLPTQKTITIGEFSKNFSKELKELKILAKKVEESAKKIEGKWKEDKEKLKVDGLDFAHEEKLETDSLEKQREVKVSSIKIGDKVVADIYLAEGKYVLESSSNTLTNKTFEKPEDVNKYLTDSKEALIAETEKNKPAELAKPVELVELKKGEVYTKALEALIKIGIPRLPSMPEITAESLKDYPSVLNVLTRFVNGLSAERVQKLSEAKTETDFEMSAKEKEDLRKDFSEAFAEQFGKIEQVNDAEVALINDLDVTIGKETPKKFNKVFGEELAKTLSMRYEIQEVPGQKDTIKIRPNGSKDDAGWETKSVTELGSYISIFKGGEEKYGKILKGEMGAEDIEKFKKDIGVENDLIEQCGTIETLMASAEGQEAIGKMGLLEFLNALMEFFKAAFQDKDFETAMEIGKDIKAGKPPREVMESSMNNMREKLSKVDDINILLDIHKNPKGSAAEATFGKDQRYRMKAKEVVQGKFEKALGLTSITDMSEIQGGSVTRIMGYKGSKQLMFDITRVPGEPIKVTQSEFKKPAPNQAEDWMPMGEQMEIKGGLEKGDDSLAVISAEVMGRSVPADTGDVASAEPEETAEQKQAKEKLATDAKTATEKLDSKQTKTLVEKVKPADVDLKKTTEEKFAELRKDEKNLDKGKIKQEVVDAWRKELIAGWAKDGKVKVEDIHA